MLKTYKPLRSKKALDRGSKLRSRSKSKRAVTKLGLWRELSEWARQSPCAKCGAPSDHAHHVVTKGSDASLYLCPDGVMPLCATCHHFAHDCKSLFAEWLEKSKPGLRCYLKRLGRTEWLCKPLDEAAEAIRKAKKRPWSEFWDALEVC